MKFRWILIAAIVLVYCFFTFKTMGWSVAMSSLLLGGLLGTGRFGFARGFSALLTHRNGSQAANSLFMVMAITLVILPLTQGIWGLPDIGQFERPISVSLAVGAVLFGIGMAMAKTCTSGAIRRLGNLEWSAAIVLVGLIIGATVATFHFEFWTMQPALAPVRLTENGVWVALALNGFIGLLCLMGIAWFSRTRLTCLVPDKSQLLLIGVFTAAVTWFAISIGRPWGLSPVFPLGSLNLLQDYFPDIDLDFMAYWLQPDRESVLMEGMWSDVLVWHVLGLVCGALSFTLWHLNPQRDGMSVKDVLPSLIGGLCMGYGAILAYGCNIGGFLSGVASGSLHGWLWLAFALTGVGVYHALQSFVSRVISTSSSPSVVASRSV